jgi:hypothetical protein
MGTEWPLPSLAMVVDLTPHNTGTAQPRAATVSCGPRGPRGLPKHWHFESCCKIRASPAQVSGAVEVTGFLLQPGLDGCHCAPCAAQAE